MNNSPSSPPNTDLPPGAGPGTTTEQALPTQESSAPAVRRDARVVEETLASMRTSVAVHRFRVSVVRGPDVGREATSEGEVLVVGKAAGVQLLLSDPQVSRFHLELRPGSEGVEVRDLGSKNGSFLGSTGFHRIVLQQDIMLRVGETSLLVELGSMQVSIELSDEVRFGSLWGDSRLMRRAFHLLRRAAQVRSPVLLRGEVGTGKHEAARSLHAAGATMGGEFVLFDCSAVPEPQVEQELFGGEGAFVAARGGTLFLHEVGDLPVKAQARLALLLERPEGQPHGVRVISASSQDIETQVNRRAFRPELYYRLAALTISLPPLRERREDIPGLVAHVLQDLQRTEGLVLSEAQQRTLTEDAMQRSWPGNLRELRAFVEHAAVLGSEDEAAPKPTPGLEVNPLLPLRDERERWSKALEVRYLTMLLEHTGWNIVATARSAGVEREYIYRLIKRHGLQRPR